MPETPGLVDLNPVSVGPCCKCKCQMWLPRDLYEAARHSPAISVFCAYGHSQHYPAGETELDKMRRERDLLAQRIAQKDDEIGTERNLRYAADRQAVAARGQVTKISKRVAKGVCPCCNRMFENMARHMKSKHPGFAEAAP